MNTTNGSHNNRKMKILLMGNGKWSCLALRELVNNNYPIVGVVAENDEFDEKEKENYARFAKFGAYESLKEAALSLGLPVYQPENINSPEFMAQIEAVAPELIVIVSYHSIVRKPLLERFPNRIINAHAGALPCYRGRAPINWAIINGEDHIGITVHFVDEGIDTGPIITQEMVNIEENDRAIDVLLKALPLFPKLVLDAVRRIEMGKTGAKPQILSEGSYFPRRSPEDGLIDWEHETAREIHNRVRALADPYPGAFIMYKGKKVIIERTSLPKEPGKLPPEIGLVVNQTTTGSVNITTTDASINLEELRVGDKIYKGADYFTIGSKII